MNRESKEERLDKIEVHRCAQTCSICGKHLDYADGCYTVTHSHYDCAFPKGYKSPAQQFEEDAEKIDKALSALGFKRKPQRTKIGQGAPTKKLKEIIEVSAKEHFGAESVTDIKIYLPSPVWRQYRFDVKRVDGDMRVDGRTISFGSWASVSELIKYHRVKWDNDWPILDMLPIYETKRTRAKAQGVRIIKNQT